MKKLVSAVLMLGLVFTLLAATGNTIMAASVTVSMGIFSAIMHVSGVKGMAFTAPIIPDFTPKTFDEIEDLEDKALFEYREKENEWHAAKSELAVYEAIEKFKAEMSEDNDADKAALAEYKEKFELLRKENIKFGLQIKSMGDRSNNLGEVNDSLKELSDNMEEIKKIGKGVSSEEVELKNFFVNKADTLRANVQGNEQAMDLTTIGDYGRVQTTMYDLFPKIPMNGSNNNGTVRYYDWDEASSVEAAEMVAEGAAYTESTAKWQKYSIDLKKVGDTIPVSDEFFADEAMFAAELRLFLIRNVADIVDYQIAYGAGTGENLDGLFTNGTAFAPSTVTHISDPTMYDLIETMDEQISKSRGSKYKPNFVVMNKSSINKMRLSKDANENYIIPPFVSADGRNVGGKVVIESNVVNDDEMLVGDRRFAAIYERSGVVVSKGFVADQFKEDMATLKVSRRLLFLVRNVDQVAFVKVTDIDAALAAIDATS